MKVDKINPLPRPNQSFTDFFHDWFHLLDNRWVSYINYNSFKFDRVKFNPSGVNFDTVKINPSSVNFDTVKSNPSSVNSDSVKLKQSYDKKVIQLSPNDNWFSFYFMIDRHTCDKFISHTCDKYIKVRLGF